MIDYDAYLNKQDGPQPDDDNREDETMPEEDLTYCADAWCDGHSLPSQRCESACTHCLDVDCRGGVPAVITKERLERTEYGRGLLAFISKAVLYMVTDWGNDDSDDKLNNAPGDRHKAAGMNNANVVTSLRDDGRHRVVLDIDHPAWLMPSTTPGHYHLYIDVPGGIERMEYAKLLDALVNANVIEPGYAGASIARGFTSVRLPWITKQKGVKQHD